MYSKLLKEKEETGLGSLSSDEFCRTDTTHVKHMVNEAYAAFREKTPPKEAVVKQTLQLQSPERYKHRTDSFSV